MFGFLENLKLCVDNSSPTFNRKSYYPRHRLRRSRLRLGYSLEKQTMSDHERCCVFSANGFAREMIALLPVYEI